jgi:hypothetical protein
MTIVTESLKSTGQALPDTEILEHLTVPSSNTLMLFVAGFHASLSALRGRERELRMTAGSGQSSGKQFAKLSPDGCWLKMSQGCYQSTLGECLLEYSEIWPKWGMMLGGVASELPISAHPIGENEFSLLGTPTATANQLSPSMREKCHWWATPNTMDSLPPKSAEALGHEMNEARPGRSRPANLRNQVSNQENWWPTPTAAERERTPEQHQKRREHYGGTKRAMYLSDAVMYPTPREAMSRQNAARNRGKGNIEDKVAELNGKATQQTKTLHLNPLWVEWLMGFPIGWSALNALETQ